MKTNEKFQRRLLESARWAHKKKKHLACHPQVPSSFFTWFTSENRPAWGLRRRIYLCCSLRAFSRCYLFFMPACCLGELLARQAAAVRVGSSALWLCPPLWPPAPSPPRSATSQSLAGLLCASTSRCAHEAPRRRLITVRTSALRVWSQFFLVFLHIHSYYFIAKF